MSKLHSIADLKYNSAKGYSDVIFKGEYWQYVSGYGWMFARGWFSSIFNDREKHEIRIGDALREFAENLCKNANEVTEFLRQFSKKSSWDNYTEIESFNLLMTYTFLDIIDIKTITESQRQKLTKFIKEQNFDLTFKRLCLFIWELLYDETNQQKRTYK